MQRFQPGPLALERSVGDRSGAIRTRRAATKPRTPMIFLMFSASSRASRPRQIVPEIGQVSTRHPFALCSTRTNISGEAPTRYSFSPRLSKKP